MKRSAKWLLGIIARALTICLVIVMLPYLSRFIASVMPDAADRAAHLSVLLSHKLTETARLETARIEDEGSLTTSQNALFFGEVFSEEIRYTYEASLGIDLSRVRVTASGSSLVLVIPEVEMLLDRITVKSVDRNDFWNPRARDSYDKRLQAEQEACRARYLEDPAKMQALRDTAEAALKKTVGEWIGAAGNISVSYRWADQETAQ